jgi:hypothetical protein
MVARPLVERSGLGALHVGLEAAEPEQPRGRPLALPNGDAPGRFISSNLQKFRAKIVHLGVSGCG